MKTQFLGQAYASRSLPLSAQTLINLYPERNESGTGEPGAFYGTPGLVTKYTGSGEVRGLYAVDGYLYAVIGDTVYAIDGSWGAVSLGTLPNASGRVSFAANYTQLLISHADGWHYVTLPTGVLTAVADTDQPTDSIVAYQDGYVIFTQGGDQFGITALDDVTSIDPLDFASAEGAPDDLISLLSDHRELWLFGERTSEVWFNSGAADFPFERIGGAFLEHGCAARWSPAKADNTVFWLGRDPSGQGMVFRADGYKPARISTHAMEKEFASYADISDAFGFTYQQDGHTFYVLTFPTASKTWAYDMATQAWHERAYRDPTTGVLERHRANCYAFFNGVHVVGDHENGKIYALDIDTYTDAGDYIYRERTFPLMEAENKAIRVDRAELVAEVGVGLTTGQGSDPQVWLQVSGNGGRTFGYERYQSLGAIGQYNHRPVWRRLGRGRKKVIRVAMTDPVKVAWLGFNVEASVCG